MNQIGSFRGFDNTVRPAQSRFSGSVVTQIQKNIRNASFEARAETAENIGFTLGERIKELEKGKKEERPKVDMRKAMDQIAKVVPVNADMERLFFKLDEALKLYSSKASLKQYLLGLLHDPGMVALVLQMYLQKKKRKKILGDILDDLIDEFGENSSIVLFSALQFGKGNEETKRKINQLYHHTAQQFLGITDFYKKLKQQIKDPKKRKKAIIAMLHSYAEDIHDASEGLFKIKIAYVIKELRRLSTILSIDYMCEEIAAFMQTLYDPNIKEISGETILGIVIEWLDISWIYDAMVHEKITSLYITSLGSQVIFLQNLLSLFKLLPKSSYESEESRSHIFETLQEEINKTAATEESL